MSNLSRKRMRVEKLEDRILLAADLDLADRIESTGGLEPTEFRSFDGTGNNVENEDWGASNTPLRRLTTVEYGDGVGSLVERVDSAGETINPRTVSNILFDQDEDTPNDRGLTSFIFQWGQFLDHDMDLTEDAPPVGVATEPGENISFLVPNDGTEEELPSGTIIPQLRSRTVVDEEGVHQQVNQITSYIDASNVYGSDDEKADALRAHSGGFLLTSDGLENDDSGTGGFLPFNTVDLNLENAAPPTTGTGVPLEPSDFFVAGDVRSNEQPGLTALHTLFLREHNYQAGRIADELGLTAEELADPEVDEHLYQLARQIVSAEVQSITYNEFLPALLGPNQLDAYQGYDPDVNAGIANIFSASLYRVGHTMLPNELRLLNEDGTAVDDGLVLGAVVSDGQVSLSDAFFNPQLIVEYGIEPYLKGLSVQEIQEVDPLISDGVRNLLFDPPAAVDLGATNLQRGRDHGLADYNQTRLDFGLEPVASFADITSDPDVAAALAEAYDADSLEDLEALANIDVFAGAISEDHVAGGSVGELIHTVLVDQFTRLRDGDRFFYENTFDGDQLAQINATRLSDIIRRNTSLQSVQDEVFRGENVMSYRAEGGETRSDMTLRVRDGQIQVVSHDGVVAARPAAEVETVVLFGTSRRDRIRIRASVVEAFDGAIEIHGAGGNDMLVASGTAGDDEISVASAEIQVNESSAFFGNVESVGVRAGLGDDLARVIGTVDAHVRLLGGFGNDILIGGSSGDLLLGGAGRDILIGSRGRDFLFGNGDEDVLVSGETTLAGNADALRKLSAIWTSDLTYEDRVAELSQLLITEGENRTVFDDEVRDLLFGGFGRDFLLFDPGDLAVDLLFGEENR